MATDDDARGRKKLELEQLRTQLRLFAEENGLSLSCIVQNGQQFLRLWKQIAPSPCNHPQQGDSHQCPNKGCQKLPEYHQWIRSPLLLEFCISENNQGNGILLTEVHSTEDRKMDLFRRVRFVSSLLQFQLEATQETNYNRLLHKNLIKQPRFQL